MGACKAKDKSVTEKISAPVQALSLKSTPRMKLEQLLDVKPRKARKSEAERVLKALGLETPSKTVKWEGHENQNQSHIFKSFVVTTPQSDQILTIKELALSGLYMAEDTPAFDRLVATNLVLNNSEDSLNIGNLVLNQPAPEIATDIIGFLKPQSDFKNLDINLGINPGSLETFVGAMLAKNVEAKTPQAHINIKSLGWGADKDTQKAVFISEDIKLKSAPTSRSNPESNNSGSAFEISLKNVSGSGIDMRHYLNFDKPNSRQGSGLPTAFPGPFTSFAKHYDTLQFSDLNAKFNGVILSTKGGQGQFRAKGDVTTIEHALQPLTIKIEDDIKSPGLNTLKESLEVMGYDQLVFQSRQTGQLNISSDTLSITDSFIDVQDGFRLSYNYEMGNVAALTKAMLEDRSDGSVNALLETLNLRNAYVALEDRSITERGFKLAAHMQNTSENLMRAQAKSLLLLAGLGAKTQAQGNLISELTKAVGKFLDTGGTLELTLNPETPIGLKALEGLQYGRLTHDDLGFSANVITP